jgi:hypothetical protein
MKTGSLTTKLCLITATSCLLLIAHAHKAYAHFPETSGALTAILHVEPDDFPPAANPETIYFIFDDLSSKFNVADCSCNLSISEKGQPLYYAPLAPPSTDQLSIYSTRGIAFTFPNQDSYQIRLVGAPLKSSDFPAFSLNWNFHVGPKLNSSSGSSLNAILVIFAAILGALLLVGVVVFSIS